MKNKEVTITIPLEFAVDIATYGETGKVTRLAQISIEKELKRLGFSDELNLAREEKTKRIFNNLNRVLGEDSMKKLNDAIETGKQAIKVANRMNNKN